MVTEGLTRQVAGRGGLRAGPPVRMRPERGRSDQPVFFNNESRGEGNAQGLGCAFQLALGTRWSGDTKEETFETGERGRFDQARRMPDTGDRQ